MDDTCKSESVFSIDLLYNAGGCAKMYHFDFILVFGFGRTQFFCTPYIWEWPCPHGKRIAIRTNELGMPSRRSITQMKMRSEKKFLHIISHFNTNMLKGWPRYRIETRFFLRFYFRRYLKSSFRKCAFQNCVASVIIRLAVCISIFSYLHFSFSLLRGRIRPSAFGYFWLKERDIYYLESLLSRMN